MSSQDSRVTDIHTLLLSEARNELGKISTTHNGSNQKIAEKKTYPAATVGSSCLLRTFQYDITGNLSSEATSVASWDLIDQDNAFPDITNIILSDNNIVNGAVANTVIGLLDCVGGTFPYTYVLTDDASGAIKIDNVNELQMNVTADVADTPYSIVVEATDFTGAIFSMPFNIDVIADPVNMKSVKFNGIDESVNCQVKPVLNFERTDPFSISTWIKSNTALNPQGIVTRRKDGSPNRGYRFYLEANTGYMWFDLGNTGTNNIEVRNGNTVIDGFWHHVVVTYDGSSTAAGVSFYIDNVGQSIVVERDNLSSTTMQDRELHIGSQEGTDLFFNGNIDEVSIWDKELSGADVTELYNLGIPTDINSHTSAVDAISWYRMGDGDIFPNFTDNTGNNDGAAINMDPGNIENDTP